MTITSQIAKFPLFQAFGVELEYMIVDRDTLNVLPITDQVMHHVTGQYANEVNQGKITWSNELALHVLEFKTTEPAKKLEGAQDLFQEQVRKLNQVLKQFNGMLMPTGMHPWMDPYQELRLWPHGSNAIYETFHQIFDCRGHGWANLQSSHLNLPFADDEDFAKLHAAIRVLLPLLPALAASSPIIDGAATPLLDNRLEAYLQNSKKIPSITGKLIPETSVSQKDYEGQILDQIYRDIAPYDPQKILQYEWLNARGAIARFERFTIEIRVLDVQECPLADLAVIQAIVAVLKALVDERWVPLEKLQAFDLDTLYHLFLGSMRDADQSIIASKGYLELFGFSDSKPMRAADLWCGLIEQTMDFSSPSLKPLKPALDIILNQGSLATRIRRAWVKDPSQAHLKEIYRTLCDCLESGRLFVEG